MIDEGTQLELHEKLHQLLSYESANQIRRNEWELMRFTKARKEFEFVVFFADYLSNWQRLELVPNSVAESILFHISVFVELLERIDNLSLESGDPDINRDNICSDLQDRVAKFFYEAINLLLYLAFRTGDITIDIENLKSEIKEAQTTQTSIFELFEDKKDELDQVISEARVAAASAGVATFTEEFNNEASNLQIQSKKWLRTTGGFAVSTAIASIIFLFWNPVPMQAGEWFFLSSLASKVAIIGVLFTCTIWCSRIYRSLVHQATVNKHRALSLKTFQAFAKSTSDPYVKDSVLMAATKSIFASVPTGFVEQVEGHEQGVNFVRFGKSAGEKIVDEVTQN